MCFSMYVNGIHVWVFSYKVYYKVNEQKTLQNLILYCTILFALYIVIKIRDNEVQ